MKARHERKGFDSVMQDLRSMCNDKNIAGMERFGIRGELLGVSVVELRRMAKGLGTDHFLALELWESGVHEARILASMLDEVELVDERQMEAWVADFDSWDLCDQCCSNLFRRTPFALPKARQWVLSEEEFVRRAGFTMFAILAVHGKDLSDETFIELLPLIESGSTDRRNFVKKSVNWALRQIGKRNMVLNDAAVEVAARLMESPEPSSRWVGRDALRELTDEKVVARVVAKS